MGLLVDGCAICNGIGEIAAGQACPVCGGTGVATAEDAAAYRQVLVDAAVQAATERFRQAGTHAAEGVLRGLAQAREDARETKARAGEVLSALLEVRRTALEIQAASLEIRSHPSAALFVEPLAPDPTDPPPGIVLPAGMGGEIFYMDSLLVRQLDVWGPFNAPNAPGILANPMTTLGDTIFGLALGVPQRLGIGTAGQVLTVSGGVPAWANNPAGFANPMTTAGDLLFENAVPAPARLPIGATGQVLTVAGGLPAWANSPAGFANPMNAIGDLILGGTAGAATRLGIGAAGQVLTVAGGTAAWQTNPAGFANPMTTSQDMIVATAGGAATRLPVGTNGQVLSVAGGAVGWATIPATLGTPLDGPPGTPTVWRQANGDILVLPLSFYNLGGDDGQWINKAFTYFPQLAGGSSAYGGSYNGPWIVGTIRLMPAIYTLTTGILAPVNSGATVNIIGHGPGTVLQCGPGVVGLTSHVAMGGPQGGPPARQNMATYERLRFDGTNGGVCGVEVGGGWGRHIDVACVNFGGPNGIGFHILNAPNAVSAEWIEKCRISVDLLQNTTSCVIEQTANLANGGADSCEYNDIDLYIIATTAATNGPGLLLQGGAYLSGGSLRIRGNFGTNSGPVVKLTGSNPNSGNNSSIYKQFLDITVESSASVNIPQTINFGGTGNKMTNNVGIFSFKFTTFTQSNVSNGAAQFSLKGLIDGDPALIAANSVVTTPAPASSTTFTNDQLTDVIAYVTGGTGVAVTVDGVATGLAAGAFHVPNGGTINLGAYSVAPTWKWVGVL